MMKTELKIFQPYNAVMIEIKGKLENKGHLHGGIIYTTNKKSKEILMAAGIPDNKIIIKRGYFDIITREKSYPKETQLSV